MPRRRSNRDRGRVASRNPNRTVAPRYSDFDENWLTQYSERQWSRLVDLTKLEDRRRWHPNRIRYLPAGPAPKALVGRPRIVIVPEGHRLARKAPWGGTVPLREAIRRRSKQGARDFRYDDWKEERFYDKYGSPYNAYTTLSHRVGFKNPWQVMICVRRQKRREVIFAIGKGGKGGRSKRDVRRNEYSDVRC